MSDICVEYQHLYAYHQVESDILYAFLQPIKQYLFFNIHNSLDDTQGYIEVLMQTYPQPM